MKKLTIIIFLLSLVYTAANGQKNWTLRECIDYALENNLDVKQMELSVESSAIELNSNQNSRLPSLSASAGQSFGFGRSPSIATGIYEASTSSGTSYSISAGMTLFQGGRINHLIKSSRLNLEAAEERVNRAREELSLNVALHFMEVLFKKELVALTEERISLTAHQLARTEIMVEEQSVPRSQLYDMQAQLASDQLASVNAHNELSAALLDLAQLLNLPNTSGFDIAAIEKVDDYVAVIGSPEEIFAIATAIKPRVREAELHLLSSETVVKIARSARFPNINLGMSYDNGFNHNFESGYANPSIKTQLKNNRRQSIGLSLSVPLFNQYQIRNGIRNAKLAVDSRRIDLEQVKNSLFKEIQQAYQGALSAQSKYTATEKAMQATSEAYRHVVARYEEAMSTPFELNEAMNKLISTQSEQLQAKYEFRFRMMVLDFYRGAEINL